jgi:ribosomal protein S18 acetylase RimI-like enzyme
MPIRLIELSDKQKILALDQLIFGEFDGGWKDKDFDHYFNYGTCFAYYEEDKPDEILGYVFSRPTSTHSHISNIGVKKECEGKGIGKALMKISMLKEEELAKKRPFSMKLQVSVDNERALNFYQNLGYVEISRSAKWIQMEAKALPQLFKEKQSNPSATSEKPKNKSTKPSSHPASNGTKEDHSDKPDANPPSPAPWKRPKPNSERNHFFSFQVLVSFTSIALGGTIIAIGIICSIYPLVGIGAGLCFCGLAGVASNLFFSSKGKNNIEHPLGQEQPAPV